VRSDGLYGIQRSGSLFNYNINMIIKGEGVTDSDPKYVQFVFELGESETV